MTDRVIVITIAFILDLIFGDPHFLWHPVMGIGKIIEYSEKFFRRCFSVAVDNDDISRKNEEVSSSEGISRTEEISDSVDIPKDDEASDSACIPKDDEASDSVCIPQDEEASDSIGKSKADEVKAKEDEAEKSAKHYKIKCRLAGIFTAITVILLSMLVAGLVLCVAGKFGRTVKIIIESIMCYQLLAMKSLKVESMKVYKALKTGDIEKSRYAVSMIVGRDTEKLDDKGVTKAAVETVAENTSDGVIAPLIFMLMFGVLGGYFYKAINTMDSMIGYKNDKYIYFGTFAAKLDDIVNFIPARISGLLMALVAYIMPGFDGKNAWKIFKRDRYNHASPNSAQTEAACAGALRVQLAGNAYYFGKLYEKPTIGDPIRNIEYEDIKRANELMIGVSVLTLFFGIIVLFLLYYL